MEKLIPAYQHPITKGFILIVFGTLLAVAGYGITQIELGLDMRDVIPKGTPEQEFIDIRYSYFGFYSISFSTRDDNAYHSTEFQTDALDIYNQIPIDSPYCIADNKEDAMWVRSFLTWMRPGCVQDQILAPDESCCLVDSLGSTECGPTYHPSCTIATANGVFEGSRSDFYLCLDGWIAKDRDYFSVAPAFFPMRKEPEVLDSSFTYEQITAAGGYIGQVDSNGNPCTSGADCTTGLTYAEMGMYANKLRDTSDYTDIITQVRGTMEDSQLDIFPYGTPFIFWEQYLTLETIIWTSIGLGVTATFFTASMLLIIVPTSKATPRSVLYAFWGGLVLALVILMMVVEIYGFMAFFDIKLSALPAVSLIMSVGVALEFTGHLTVVFVSATGDYNTRMGSALDHMFLPTIDGTLSTLVGIIALAFSDFDFIFLYYFMLYALIIFFGCINGLILLPVLLSLIGPPSIELSQHKLVSRRTSLSPRASLPNFVGSSTAASDYASKSSGPGQSIEMGRFNDAV